MSVGYVILVVEEAFGEFIHMFGKYTIDSFGGHSYCIFQAQFVHVRFWQRDSTTVYVFLWIEGFVVVGLSGARFADMCSSLYENKQLPSLAYEKRAIAYDRDTSGESELVNCLLYANLA